MESGKGGQPLPRKKISILYLKITTLVNSGRYFVQFSTFSRLKAVLYD